MEASMDSCGIIYLCIYFSDSEEVVMIFNPWLFFNESAVHPVLGHSDDGHSSMTMYEIMEMLPMS